MARVAVGTRFRKAFGKHGMFSGEVILQHPTEPGDEEELFQVRYEDGDGEDLSLSEIRALLAMDKGKAKAASPAKRKASREGGG